MALADLIKLETSSQKIGISEERIAAIMPALRDYIAYWREYPDMFVDFMVRGHRTEYRTGEFKLYYYQRIFMRAAMRYQYMYGVFPRGYSKSFLSVLVRMCQCVLYPRVNLFMTSGGKQQAASILQEKVNQICTLIPAFHKEIDWSRGQTKESKDYCIYIFKNGSTLDNVAATERSRGQRRTGGLIEECAGVDGQILQEVIIPIMAISRRAMDGSVHESEPINKSQIYITTAGYKSTYAYERLIDLLVRSVLRPNNAIILGGTWRIPVATGLQSKNFINDAKEGGTFNEASFDREYESKWTGDVADAFFGSDMFDRNRILNQPEYAASGRASKSSYYILSADVGRRHDQTAVLVFNVIPQPQSASIKKLVNIITLNDEHFGDQALKLKKLYYQYKAKRIIIDANGAGIGLIDYMVKPTIDTETNETLPDFGVYSGTQADAADYYKRYRTPDCEDNAMYLMKATAPINTEAHSNTQVQLSSGKVKLLIDEREAKTKLLGTTKGQKMTPEERKEYLLPFTLTSILKDEINLNCLFVK